MSPSLAVRDGVPDDFPKEPDVPLILQQHYAARFSTQQLGLKQTEHFGVPQNNEKNVVPMAAHLLVRHQFDQRNANDRTYPSLGFGLRQNAAIEPAEKLP